MKTPISGNLKRMFFMEHAYLLWFGLILSAISISSFNKVRIKWARSNWPSTVGFIQEQGKVRTKTKNGAIVSKRYYFPVIYNINGSSYSLPEAEFEFTPSYTNTTVFYNPNNWSDAYNIEKIDDQPYEWLLIFLFPLGIYCISKFFKSYTHDTKSSKGTKFHGFQNIQHIKKSIKYVLGVLKSEMIYKHLQPINIERILSLCPDNATELHSNPDLSELISNIANSIGINATSITVQYNYNLCSVAQVLWRKNGTATIELNPNKIINKYQLLGSLSHELTHIFLFERNVTFEIESENEILTDVASVLLGIGWLSLNAYSRTINHKQELFGNVKITRESKIGYLTLEEFAYVQARRDVILDKRDHGYFNSTVESVYRSVLRLVKQEIYSPPSARSGIFQKLLYNKRKKELLSISIGQRKDYGHYSLINEEKYRIEFHCPACVQKMRIPVESNTEKAINIKCNNCDLVFPCII
jgi:hypothetical protein